MHMARDMELAGYCAIRGVVAAMDMGCNGIRRQDINRRIFQYIVGQDIVIATRQDKSCRRIGGPESLKNMPFTI